MANEHYAPVEARLYFDNQRQLYSVDVMGIEVVADGQYELLEQLRQEFENQQAEAAVEHAMNELHGRNGAR